MGEVFNNSLALDSQGHAHVAYGVIIGDVVPSTSKMTTGAHFGLRYARGSAEGWETTETSGGQSPMSISLFNDIAIDGSGFPHICSNDLFQVTHRTNASGAWQTEPVLVPATGPTAIEMDRRDHAHISFAWPADMGLPFPARIEYATNAGGPTGSGTWPSTTISETPLNTGSGYDTALTPDGRVVVCYAGDDGTLLYSIQCRELRVLAPRDGATLASFPGFQWSARGYDLFGLYLFVPVGGEYYPIPMRPPLWTTETGLDLSPLQVLWDMVDPGAWIAWSVVGIDSITWEWELAGPRWFRKADG